MLGFYFDLFYKFALIGVGGTTVYLLWRYWQWKKSERKRQHRQDREKTK